MQKEQLEQAQDVLRKLPETTVLLTTGEGKQVAVFGAHLVSKKLLGVLSHVLGTLRTGEVDAHLVTDAGKLKDVEVDPEYMTVSPNDPIPWSLNTITFRTDGVPEGNFATYNADQKAINVNLKELGDFTIEQVKMDTETGVHGVMSMNGMFWWLCLDTMLHDLFHSWSVNIDREWVEANKEEHERQASDWATNALIKLAEEVDLDQPSLADEPWFGLQAWAVMLDAIHKGHEWAAVQQRMIDKNLAWGKEGATSAQDEKMESFRDYVRIQMAKVEEPWGANVTQIELVENGSGIPMFDLMPETDVMEDVEAAAEAEKSMDTEAIPMPIPEIETEDLELANMPEPEGINDRSTITDNTEDAEEIEEVTVESPEASDPSLAVENLEHEEVAVPEPLVPDQVVSADGEVFDLDDAMAMPDEAYEIYDAPEMPPPATTAAPGAVGPAIAATPASLGDAPPAGSLTPSSHIKLEDPGFTKEQYETVILGIYKLLSYHIYEKCGWQRVADPSTANSPVDFCTLTDPNAILEGVSLQPALSKVPGSEKMLLVMDTLTEDGRWAPDTPISGGVVKGQIFKNANLPGYTLTFNVGGTKIKRSIVPQNPNKRYDDGNLKRTAIAARQGSAVCWIMDGMRGVSKFHYKSTLAGQGWEDTILEKLS